MEDADEQGELRRHRGVVHGQGRREGRSGPSTRSTPRSPRASGSQASAAPSRPPWTRSTPRPRRSPRWPDQLEKDLPYCSTSTPTLNAPGAIPGLKEALPQHLLGCSSTAVARTSTSTSSGPARELAESKPKSWRRRAAPRRPSAHRRGHRVPGRAAPEAGVRVEDAVADGREAPARRRLQARHRSCRVPLLPRRGGPPRDGDHLARGHEARQVALLPRHGAATSSATPAATPSRTPSTGCRSPSTTRTARPTASGSAATAPRSSSAST
jgi:hypothetical protein